MTAPRSPPDVALAARVTDALAVADERTVPDEADPPPLLFEVPPLLVEVPPPLVPPPVEPPPVVPPPVVPPPVVPPPVVPSPVVPPPVVPPVVPEPHLPLLQALDSKPSYSQRSLGLSFSQRTHRATLGVLAVGPVAQALHEAFVGDCAAEACGVEV